MVFKLLKKSIGLANIKLHKRDLQKAEINYKKYRAKKEKAQKRLRLKSLRKSDKVLIKADINTINFWINQWEDKASLSRKYIKINKENLKK